MRHEETLGLSQILGLAERELRKQLNNKLESLSLTLPQYSALSTLEETPEISNAELARKCGVTAQTMHKVIELLLRSGTVKQKPNPANSLAQKLSLTPKGLKTVCVAHTKVNEVETKFIDGINFNLLKTMLIKGISNLE